MIESAKIKKIPYGGDYNPEQWPEDSWAEDMRLFKLAHINILTVNVFSWAMLQPKENTYDFSKLDKIMELIRENDLNVCLATSTAAHPAWMARKYPDILRTTSQGMKRKFGSRHNSCPNSPTYYKYASALVKRLAERYKTFDNIVAWHVSNEYGDECHCENCEKAFRIWLKNRYKTIDEVNRAWDTAFWGHTFYDFEDIVLPNYLSEHWGDERSTFQGISIDYRRFNSESMMNMYRMEYDILHSITPDIPITTNLMGTYQPLDYKKWAKYMDFISWDSYPSCDTNPDETAMRHDLMRGLKGGKPFSLMEQTPSVTNWQPYNMLKRPGVMRLLSYQAIAHGADTVMFFQMKRSIGACEKYHGAIIDHCGHENTRVFKEASTLGKELEALKNITLGAKTPAKVALLFDWENWWGIHYSAGPSIYLNYIEGVMNFYRALFKNNIPVDIIGTEDELTGYDIVIAPVLYMIKSGYDEKLRAYVERGGRFITTFFSGYVDDSDLVTIGGYPGKLRDILGIWVEEEDALPPDVQNSFIYNNKQYPARIICDLLHTERADILSTYDRDFYAGMPALTKHSFGSGFAYYIATSSNDEFYSDYLTDICLEAGVAPVMPASDNVEVTLRKNDLGEFIFILNHGDTPYSSALPFKGVDLLTNSFYDIGKNFTLAPKDVMIIRKDDCL